MMFRVAPIFMLAMLVCPIAASLVMSNYPFIKNMSIRPISTDGNIVTASITFDIYFTQQAWRTFHYRDGSFPYMSDWWENHVGNTFNYMGHTAKLLDIQWTQLQHYSNHDRLNAIVKLQIIR